MFGLVHNPFSAEWKNEFFASKLYTIFEWKKSKTSCKVPFNLVTKTNSYVTITNEIEYENYDLFMLLEALGGLLEVFFVCAGFIMYPINQFYFNNELKEKFGQIMREDLFVDDAPDVFEEVRIEDVF